MDLQYGCVFCLLKFKETKHTWGAKSGSSRNQYYLIASNGMSICYAVTPGGWKGLRRTPFASLTPAPPTIYFVPLSRNSYLAGPSPCPCPGVDTPPQSLPSSLFRHIWLVRNLFADHLNFKNSIMQTVGCKKICYMLVLEGQPLWVSSGHISAISVSCLPDFRETRHSPKR